MWVVILRMACYYGYMIFLKYLVLIFMYFMLGAIPACAQTNLEDGLYVRFVTTQGEIVARLYYDLTPLTVVNFVGLAEGKLDTEVRPGKPYYDGLKFHRVVPNFVIQGGDPRGDGTGGPGYNFPDEFHPQLRHDSPGILSMANSGPGTNGSQFFITHVATPWLDDKHSVFGKVVSGMDVVNAIAEGDSIEKIVILRVGEAAEAFKNDQETFAELIAGQEERKKQQIQEELANNMKIIEERWPDAKQTKNGVYIVEKERANATKVVAGNVVSVHYVGTLLDGTQFDSSYDRNQPIELTIGAGMVIPGWEEALQEMGPGDSITAIIPPELAYGDRGVPGVIPPSSFLVFDMELVSSK